MTFIEKKKVIKAPSFIPIKPSFRNRKFGSEFNKWELDLLREFSNSKKLVSPVISGIVVFDRTLGRNRFVLIPAAHLSQDYVICECPDDIPIPSNLSEVTITGKRKAFFDYWEIYVEKISPHSNNNPVKPEISFQEFQDKLFLQWGGLDPLMKDLLAFEFVSSPPIMEFHQAGGLNLTLYDGTNSGESKKLLHYFRRILPNDIALGKSGKLAIPELATNQPLSPFSWSFKSFDADRPLSQKVMTFLDKRKSKRLSEISVGLGSKRSQPSSIYEPPLTMVDQPTLLPDNVEMLRMNFDPPLEVTKYVISMQMLFPAIGKKQTDIDLVLEEASNSVVNLAERYDLPQTVRRHGLFDPSYYGKPQSIIRLGLASARSKVKKTTDTSELMSLFNSLYLKNMESILQTWDEVFSKKGVEMVSLKEFDRQLFKFISEKEGEFGVSFAILSDRFATNKYNEIELRKHLDKLKDLGKIREPIYNVFKSIPFE